MVDASNLWSPSRTGRREQAAAVIERLGPRIADAFFQSDATDRIDNLANAESIDGIREFAGI